MDGPRPPPIDLQPGQVPTPAQIEQIQAHMRADAERMGISFEAYIEQLKAAHAAQVAAQQQAQGEHQHGPNCNHDHSHDGQQMVQQEVQPGPPKPEAVAMANFLMGQDLKVRTCIFQENRKDMFRGRDLLASW
jgi:translocation protein SEC62